MELEQLRCFAAVAEQLHFGRAAQSVGLLPASLGRHVRLLEESLGTSLLTRTTRSVTLTEDGVALLKEVRPVLARLDEVADQIRSRKHSAGPILRIGAIDSAAAGLIPMLLHDFREIAPQTTTQLVEDKSIRLIPKLLAGRLDLILIRPSEGMSASLVVKPLFYETAVVAVPERSALASQCEVSVRELQDEPMIVPERRSRPHSYDLTMELFSEIGLRPRIAQIADEKQTIINLVAAGIGSAIVPKWTSKLAASGVKYLPLSREHDAPMHKLPLAVAWMKAVREPARDLFIELLTGNIEKYSALA
ncbi:transcriptional regulator [Rhizobium leguminosarum bv. trifolii WSM2012]|nr:transcriptional regulator [Rhizobium leguminosarum bv. trifolii WSM2012]